jgi:restriction endonuclease S subunit
MELKNIVSIKIGYPVRSRAEPKPDGDLVLIQMKDVSEEAGVDTSNLFLIKHVGRKLPEFLQPGDLLFYARGHKFFTVLVKNVPKNTVASSQFFIIKIKEKCITPEYLNYYINSSISQKYFESRKVGSAVTYISRDVLAELPIVIPDIMTQKKIVDIEQSWNIEKSLLNQLINRKHQLVEKIVKEMITHKIRIKE